MAKPGERRNQTPEDSSSAAKECIYTPHSRRATTYLNLARRTQDLALIGMPTRGKCGLPQRIPRRDGEPNRSNTIGRWRASRRTGCLRLGPISCGGRCDRRTLAIWLSRPRWGYSGTFSLLPKRLFMSSYISWSTSLCTTRPSSNIFDKAVRRIVGSGGTSGMVEG